MSWLLLVISIRNYGFARQRNSSTAEWIAFADRCDKARFAPIFVPDTEVVIATEPADLGVTACLAACWNLEIRMALYETALLDVGDMHRPLELCWLNENARYLIFIPVGADANNSVQAFNRARPQRWRRSRLRNALISPSCGSPTNLPASRAHSQASAEPCHRDRPRE